ncbi:integrase [Alteromonas sp. a30]|uniref:integrase n=1 Tax=Alteromonas sp. a30 TaxID=2730917 RepID=UPI002280368C|nr:integrase [Alteromonas sp. a30]MCY7297320.1 integrase [Alteromonas sp. a30]
MAPRQRKPENRDLPQGLRVKTSRGVKYFVYRYPNGNEFWFPQETTRHDAIEACTVFNREHRNPAIKLLEKGDRYNKPLKAWLSVVKKRVKAEENLGNNAWSTFEKDCERLSEFGGDVYTKSIDLEFVNDYLAKFAEGKSNNVYNRKISFLKKVFDYLIDESAMEVNYAERKKTKKKDEKSRQRLTLDNYRKIHEQADLYLQVAMELAIQTTHASLEISRIKYTDCAMYDVPTMSNGLVVYGIMRIHRQKVQKLESSYVEIPITQAIKNTIDKGRSDKLACPYVVHRAGRYRSQIGEGCDHPFQLSSKYLSRAFSDLRDDLGLYNHLDKKERPTFHEIRALAAKMFKDIGVSPSARMAHANEKTTEIYTENHVEWTRVPAAELKVF